MFDGVVSLQALRKFLSKRPAGLSITHNVGLQGCSEGYVGQLGETAPHDDVSRWRVLGAGKVAAEPGDVGKIQRECPWRRAIMGRVGDQAVEHGRFQLGQYGSRFEVRRGSIEHRQPEDPPAQK